MLDELCSRHIADVRESDPVAERGHPVSTAGAGISAGQRRKLHVRGDVVHLSLHLAQRQTESCAGRGDVLEGGGSGQAAGLLQLLHQLDGVQGIQKIDVAGLAVQDGDGQVRAILHIDAAGLLVGVAAVLQCEFIHWCILLVS